MNSTATINGLFLGLLFIGTVSLGQFVAPTGNPATPETNSVATLDTAGTFQEKKGDFGVSYFTGKTELCMGVNCISSWWPISVATSCKLEVKHLYSSIPNLNTRYFPCESFLSLPALNDGWISTSHDYCTGENGNNDDCDNGAHCSYMRLVCTGSATSTAPLSQYVLGAAMPYYFTDSVPFVRLPQCNDSVDQPSPDLDTLIDYPADPECQAYWDDDETNL